MKKIPFLSRVYYWYRYPVLSQKIGIWVVLSDPNARQCLRWKHYRLELELFPKPNRSKGKKYCEVLHNGKSIWSDLDLIIRWWAVYKWMGLKLSFAWKYLLDIRVIDLYCDCSRYFLRGKTPSLLIRLEGWFTWEKDQLGNHGWFSSQGEAQRSSARFEFIPLLKPSEGVRLFITVTQNPTLSRLNGAWMRKEEEKKLNVSLTTDYPIK